MASTTRWAALIWVVAAGCYVDRPQQSTLPDPEFAGGGAGASTVSPGVEPGDPGQGAYAAGPPGGGMDPGSVYRPDDGTAPEASDAGDDEDNVARAQAQAQPRLPPPIPAPEPGEAPDASSDAAPAMAAAGAMADVSDTEIDAALTGYGQWVDTDDYGEVWRPDATVVGMDFTPYESGGSWAQTDAGWAFDADYTWGWLPFHYGRWAWFNDYWGWVPGHRWGAAWVDWRNGNGVIGWRPRPPGHGYHHNGYQYGGGAVVRDHRHATSRDNNWRFATTRDFTRPHIRSHLYGNPGEGLRLTARGQAPQVRARTTVPASDVMRGRYAPRPGARATVRDHRTIEQPDRRPGNAYYRPSGGDAPAARGYPPARSYPPAGGHPSAPIYVNPSAPAGGNASTSGGYYAPGRGYGGRGGAAPSTTGRFGGNGVGAPVTRDHRSEPAPASSYHPSAPPAAAPSHAAPAPAATPHSTPASGPHTHR